jgi:hypothetical protein
LGLVSGGLVGYYACMHSWTGWLVGLLPGPTLDEVINGTEFRIPFILPDAFVPVWCSKTVRCGVSSWLLTFQRSHSRAEEDNIYSSHIFGS